MTPGLLHLAIFFKFPKKRLKTLLNPEIRLQPKTAGFFQKKIFFIFFTFVLNKEKNKQTKNYIAPSGLMSPLVD